MCTSHVPGYPLKRAHQRGDILNKRRRPVASRVERCCGPRRLRTWAAAGPGQNRRRLCYHLLMLGNRPVCPACDCEDFAPKRVRHGLTMGICGGCGLAYAHPLRRGGNDQVGDADSSITNPAYYEGLIRDYAHQSAAAAKKVPLQFRYWSGILGRQPRSVLEVGCGTGQYCNAWKQLGVSWQGTEVNPAMIDFCLARGVPVSPLAALKGQTFDALFMSQVLEHILTPQSFLRTVQGFLVPGGILHLDVPNHGSLASLVRRIAGNDYGAVQPTHHLLGYSEPPLRRLLENADFDIVHIAAHTNDDPLFGQLGPFRLRGKLQHLASAAMGRGSMLVAVARKPCIK